MTTLENVRQRAEDNAKARGYSLNYDPDFLEDLLKGLLRNEERYGYPSCPCRLASGKFEVDKDIICPCEYRDIDVEEYGACHCTLYVNREIARGNSPIPIVPERRPSEKQTVSYESIVEDSDTPSNTAAFGSEEPGKTGYKLWFCRQCGYVCYRENPPYICPICKAKKEMFAEVKI